ncbi:hypothetical protein ACMU_15925 [Actibacterium mucosum KCTC 23349]|uniref:YdhG-like domain-containing protein n=1 Tax=Actibacterium mucosum KCTC 23349 TaxID=1454373 RepID=A0A037ZI60_9RHOB|nr:DUF1801 domain-containing protein [Actibacterium mucosum]KAJ55242.1 hypothetical protein ACMU_15925 [Actibacterium mucosum KCTC 23349]
MGIKRVTTGAQAGLDQLRALILSTAAEMPEVGAIEETTKWGQPSFAPTRPRTGTPLRLGQPKEGGFAIYAHCATSVISDFQALFPDEFRYDGNRAVLFDTPGDIQPDKLRLLITAALRYHLR